MAEKKGDPRSVKFHPGLEDAIEKLADELDRDFAWVVNHLCDEALHSRSYKFPFHKPKYILNSSENEGNHGKTP